LVEIKNINKESDLLEATKKLHKLTALIDAELK